MRIETVLNFEKHKAMYICSGYQYNPELSLNGVTGGFQHDRACPIY